MDSKTVTTLILLAGIGVVGYALTRPTQQQYPVPPGQSFSGTYNGVPYQWTNTTGQPVWVTTTGVITNALGQVLTSVSQIMQNIPGNYQNSNPNSNPSVFGIAGWYGGGLN